MWHPLDVRTWIPLLVPFLHKSTYIKLSSPSPEQANYTIWLGQANHVQKVQLVHAYEVQPDNLDLFC